MYGSTVLLNIKPWPLNKERLFYNTQTSPLTRTCVQEITRACVEESIAIRAAVRARTSLYSVHYVFVKIYTLLSREYTRLCQFSIS